MDENKFEGLSFEELEAKHRSFKGHLTRARDRLTRVLDRNEPELVKEAFDDAQKKIRKITAVLDAMDLCKPPVSESGEVSEITSRFHDELMSAADDVELRYQSYKKALTNVTPMNSSSEQPTSSKDEEMLKLIKAQSEMVEKLTKKLDEGKADKRPSIRTPGLPAPCWDGAPRNFQSWRVRIDQYFESAGINRDREKLMVLLNGRALPKSVQDNITDCCSVEGDNGAWARLKEKVPTSAIVRDVILGLQSLKLMRTATAKDMRPVLDGLTDFARRMRELGKEQELSSSVVVELASQKIEADLNFEYMRQIKNDEPTLSSLISFLRRETEARERREQPHMFGDIATKSSAYHIVGQASAIDGATALSNQPVQFSTQTRTSAVTETNIERCPFCVGHPGHLIIRCPIFLSKSNEERRTMIMDAKRCFLCFRSSHNAARCTRQDKTRCNSCQFFHHRLVACPPSSALRSQIGLSSLQGPSANTPRIAQVTQAGAAGAQNPFLPSQTKMNPPSWNTIGNLNSMHAAAKCRRYSPTTFVEIQDKNGVWHRVVAFFDSGADTTLIKSATVERLGLEGDPFKFTYGVAGGGTVQESSARYVVRIKPLQKGETYKLVAISVEKPAHNSPSVGEELFEEYPHLTVAKGFLPTEEAEIDLIIGYDYQNLTMPHETVRSLTNPDAAPTAARSDLGWTIFGGDIPKPTANAISRVQFLHHMDDLQLLYTSDVVGVKPTTLCTCTDKEIAESQFVKHCREKLRVNEAGRMSVEMPWKEGFPDVFECNRTQAEARLITQEARLIRNQTIDEYNNEIQKLMDSGFVRQLVHDENRDEGWYLQHHAVYQPHKTTKIRIVWNSAAKFRGLCLNDGFHKGPDLLNSLVKCFLHWRKDSVAVAGDVRKMFNQIELSVRDQRFHRFVWRFGDTSAPVTYFQWLRLPFGDKPAPDISMMAVRLLAETATNTDPEGSLRIKDRMYMDDITDSFAEPEAAIETMDQVNHILGGGSFEIKEWHSNHPLVDRCPEDRSTRVLGHLWNKSSDLVSLQLDRFVEELNQFTKRKAASLVAKLWDPTGMLSPVSIRYKIGLQEMWAARLDWDDTLGDERTEVWKGYVHEMNQLIGFEMPRRLRPDGSVGKPQLHAFSDAGGAALGSVIWLRWDTPNGVELTFAIAKALVAPLKQRSIPRLELTAAVVMARLTTIVLEVVGDVSSSTFWTDSEVVLSWVRSPARTFKPFVSARVQEIQDALPSCADGFRYVPSNLNPADALTKPIYPRELHDWIQGPEFLLQEPDRWPCQEPDYDNDAKRRIVKEYTPEAIRRVNQVVVEPYRPLTFEEQLGASTSDWNRLVRQVARCRRFLLPKKRRPESLTLTPFELQESERALFYVSQSAWENGETDRWTTRKLNPKVDENGLVRVEGRLRKLHLPEEQKRPVLLRRDSLLVELLAKHIHRTIGHQGYRVAIASAFKRGIYILGGSKLFKDVATKCIFCRTRRRALLSQQMGELPSFRGDPHTPPFHNVALDFFGPIVIKLTRNTNTDGNIMIVTCTTTRAVSLELVDSLSSESFINAWRRFSCVRGVHPVTAFSDRGRNFVGAQEKLRKWIDSWDVEKVKTEFAKTNTRFDWQFNTPSASHMNGVVESLIRSCRKGLDAVADYHHRKFNALEWQTILAEVTYLINSRPLFPDGPDPLQSPPITGNDILYPHGQPVVLQPNKNIIADPRSLVDLAQQRVQTFWEVWMCYMPPQLVQRSKWFHPRDNLQVGDLVLLLEPGLKGGIAPRGMWKRALVEKVHPGEDGLVRKATVRTVEGTNVTTKERPVKKMCLIATVGELEHGFRSEQREV